jgi:ABC-type branched-subunit amino acid transport system substrate-binding protein
LKDFGQETIQIVIKDTAGQAASAQAAANESVGEGSAAILGPVFSGNVSAASAITLPAGRTMIAFSTDATVARRGVYLISFTPQDDTRRAISFALSQGRRSYLAFLPNNSEGTLREAVFRQTVGAAGGNVQVIKYDRSGPSIEQAAAKAAPFLQSVDTVYIPEGNEIPNAILQEFRKAGTDVVGKLILGSGSWESVKLSDPMLDNAVYPGRDLTNFGPFAQRYETQFGSKPGVWAGMGYDAVTLATKLVQQNGAETAFKPQSVENTRGFAGINGIFRLRPDGTAERGLAIYRVTGGQGQLLEPAPNSFTRSGF